MPRVSIAGGSGYAGGELLRLLHTHPEVELGQVTSQRHAAKPLHRVHPNLRGRTDLRFSPLDQLEPCDVLFLCLPHGNAAANWPRFDGLAPRVIDLSADFRLSDPVLRQRFYPDTPVAPDVQSTFVYGLPELHRSEISSASRVAGPGCNATVALLGLAPLFGAGVVDRHRTVVDVKVGSSEGGNQPSEASHHPIRSGSLRSFKPTGHRHSAELLQELGGGEPIDIHFSVTSVDNVRGALATSHVFLNQDLSERDLWTIYREAVADEPFLRIVKERSGVYRYPEPKLLAGTNTCDLGFELDETSRRVVVLSAIDNLMKGAAGQAVQCFNLMHGFPETQSLDFPGLHPI